ncbi:MAG: hypothetical protein IJU02_07115 [Lachnospiraceae bacterium]|nr:hypothetical protein [Lachnospiraceae bacterium]
MNLKEFSDGFDTLVGSYRRFKDFDKKEELDSIEFNEYEKSFFLTKAENEVVINYYNGKNVYGDSFESTEEIRRYLDSLIKTKSYSLADNVEGNVGVSDKSVFFKLPETLAFITLEQVIYDDITLGCYNGKRANVYPVTQDEYATVKDNPFRGPTRYKALRLDYGDNIVEIIPKYSISNYLIKYVSKPSPIILEDLPNALSIDGVTEATECELNSILHNTILERAVALALATKSTGNKEK